MAAPLPRGLPNLYMSISIGNQIRTPAAAPNRLLERLLSALPRGGALPDEAWRARHRAVVVLLWMHVVGVFAFGMVEGFGVLHVFLEAGLIALAAVWATSPRGGRMLRTLAACFGLIASSAVLVHLSGGYVEMHFHFFIMLAVIALYQEWLPFLFSIAFVAAHHGIVGAIDPTSVYNNPDAIAHPWKWAGIHAGFIAAASVVYVVGWHLTETANKQTRRSEEKFSKAFYNSPLSITITGPDGRLVDINEAFSRLTGYDRESCIGHSSDELGLWVNTDDWRAVNQMIAATGFAGELQTQFRTKDGGILDCLITAEVIDLADGNCVLSLVKNITDSVAAEKTIRQSEERFRTLIENGSDVILILSETGNITYASPSAQSVMGYLPEDVIGTQAFELVRPDDLTQVLESFGRTLQGINEPEPIEFQALHKDGTWRVLEAMSGRIGEGSDAMSVVVNCREITQRKQAEETIRHLAYHDSLTGLPNRALLEDRLAIALARAQRSAQTLAVIFVDLDEFKLVNDTLGHSIGDELLRAAAERLRTLVRDGDTVARVGGDEFVLLLNDVEGVDDAVEVAERVSRSLKEPYRVAQLELTVTASTGISIFPTDGEDATALLRNADTAMYRAKDEGRDNFQLYTSGMGEQVRKRLTLENELRRAIEQQQLVLHYQPIVDINSGEISSCEALVRWQHPERGLVPPAEFIGVAEKAGLITALSEWVMRTACLQHKVWQDAGLCPVPIAVNISSHRFQYTNFGETTRRILDETSLDPRNLHLEITEGVLMEDVDRAATVLKGLRDLGMCISIDDFGTGYSSLSYLRHLPIDDLKIDMSFVSGIMSNREDQAIVRAIIALAKSLRLKVIAEGVETEEELQFLRDEGCDLAQGFLFARPMPAPDFAKLIAAAKALVPATSLPLR